MNQLATLRTVVAIGVLAVLHSLDFMTTYSLHLWSFYSSVADWLRTSLEPMVGAPMVVGVVNAVVMSLHASLVFAAYWLLGFIPFFRTRFANCCNCRKCGHTLCGLSEPRCPECGEMI